MKIGQWKMAKAWELSPTLKHERGSWKAFVDFEKQMDKAQEPRTMDLATGGRIGFFKGKRVGPNQWKVKFPGLSAKPKGVEMGDEWFGTQVYSSEEAMNDAIKERSEISKKNITLKNKKLGERTTQLAEEGYKDIIDDFIEKGDYENFKSQIYESGKKHKLPSGKWRQSGGGRVPTHIVKFIRDRLDAGPGTELFEDLIRITGKSEEDLLNFNENLPPRGDNPSRSVKAAKSTAKLNPKNKELVDLVNGGVTKKADLLDALKVTDDEFQKMVTVMFKQGYENRSKLNKNPDKPLTSYLGSSSGKDDVKRAVGEYDKLIENLNKIDGIDKARERLITSRIQQVYGVDGSHPNSKMFKTMTDRVNEFYKLKKILPEEIVLNLDHAIPMSLVEQLTEANTLRVNVQPITQSLNMGLKAQVDKAYAAAYKAGDKETMRAIEEVANKIDLPMGKITDTFTDLGKNPYLTGDMKQVIYNNLVIQNSISEKAGKLDKELLKKAGLDKMSFDVGKVDTQTVAKLFSEGDPNFTKFVSGVGKKVKSGGKLYSFPAMLGDKELMKGVGKDIGTVAKKGLRFLASDWVWPEVVLGGLEYFNLKQKGAEHDRALSGAIDMSTLGLVDLQGTEKAIVDQARKLGYDDEAVKNLELLIQSKQIEKAMRGEYKNFEAIQANLEGENPDPRLNNWGMLDSSEKRLEKLKNDYEAVRKQFTGGEEIYNIFDKSQEELARAEWNRSLEGRKKRLDPYAGGIGNWVNKEIFTLDPQTKRALQKEIDMMNPQQLEDFNIDRGVGQETYHPLYGAGMSYKQMEPFYEEMDYMYKADGGIASLKKKW